MAFFSYSTTTSGNPAQTGFQFQLFSLRDVADIVTGFASGSCTWTCSDYDYTEGQCVQGWQCVNGCVVKNACTSSRSSTASGGGGSDSGTDISVGRTSWGSICQYKCTDYKYTEGQCVQGWQCVNGCVIQNACTRSTASTGSSGSVGTTQIKKLGEKCEPSLNQCDRGLVCGYDSSARYYLCKTAASTTTTTASGSDITLGKCNYRCTDYKYTEGQCVQGWQCINGCVINNGCTRSAATTGGGGGGSTDISTGKAGTGCSDTDASNSLYKKGEVVDVTGKRVSDSCHQYQSTWVQEFSCDSAGRAAGQWYTCRSGEVCSDGICVVSDIILTYGSCKTGDKATCTTYQGCLGEMTCTNGKWGSCATTSPTCYSVVKVLPKEGQKCYGGQQCESGLTCSKLTTTCVKPSQNDRKSGSACVKDVERCHIDYECQNNVCVAKKGTADYYLDFKWSPSTPAPSQSVTFTASTNLRTICSSIGTAPSYKWELLTGSGSTRIGTSESISYKFSSDGSYSVKLSAWCGISISQPKSLTKTIKITKPGIDITPRAGFGDDITGRSSCKYYCSDYRLSTGKCTSDKSWVCRSNGCLEYSPSSCK